MPGLPWSSSPLLPSTPRRRDGFAAVTLAAVLVTLAATPVAQSQFAELASPVPRLPNNGDQTRAVAIGDVDRDGDLDLITGNGDGSTGQQNRLWLNDGTGRFADATAGRMPVDADSTWALALGDVDGDGDLDLVVGNGRLPFGRTNRLYLNDGTGTFTDATTNRLPGNQTDVTAALALGDLDGDGDLDLIVGSRGGNPVVQNRLYLNNGAGTFTDATGSNMPANGDLTMALALGDVDGDRDLDLVVGTSGLFSAQNRLYLNNGAGVFTDATATRLPVVGDQTQAVVLGDQTQAVVLGDVDGDGDLDLLAGNAGQERLHLNDGTGTFTDVTALRLPVDGDTTTSLVLGDLDGDGDLDLVKGSNQLGLPQERLYVNDGTGTFTDATAARLPVDSDYTAALALGDLDGDGDPDLVLGNFIGPTRLYLNLQRQLDAPGLLRAGQAWQLDAYARNGRTTPNDVALPFLAFARANISLPPFGTLGIDPSLMVVLPPIPVPQPAGLGSVALPFPTLPALYGTRVYAQALLLQQPVQVRLTNVVADTYRQ